jgi:hypothetical protein
MKDILEEGIVVDLGFTDLVMTERPTSRANNANP